MFKITDYSELNGQVAMTIVYTMNGEAKKDERIYDTKENAMRYFASSAHTFLNIQICEFKRIAFKTSNHYLNSECVPFINDNRWTRNWWNFLEVNRQLSKDFAQPFKYANIIYSNIHIFKAVIPELIQLHRHELKAILSDVEATAKDLMATIKKLQDGNFIVESKNIAV